MKPEVRLNAQKYILLSLTHLLKMGCKQALEPPRQKRFK